MVGEGVPRVVDCGPSHGPPPSNQVVISTRANSVCPIPVQSLPSSLTLAGTASRVSFLAVPDGPPVRCGTRVGWRRLAMRQGYRVPRISISPGDVGESGDKQQATPTGGAYKARDPAVPCKLRHLRKACHPHVRRRRLADIPTRVAKPPSVAKPPPLSKQQQVALSRR